MKTIPQLETELVSILALAGFWCVMAPNILISLLGIQKKWITVAVRIFIIIFGFIAFIYGSYILIFVCSDAREEHVLLTIFGMLLAVFYKLKFEKMD
jgi:hypothetical protein